LPDKSVNRNPLTEKQLELTAVCKKFEHRCQSNRKGIKIFKYNDNFDTVCNLMSYMIIVDIRACEWTINRAENAAERAENWVSESAAGVESVAGAGDHRSGNRE